jgi:lysyl endopeptidase
LAVLLKFPFESIFHAMPALPAIRVPRTLLAALAAFALGLCAPAAAQPLPVVPGEPVIGDPAKAAVPASLLTTEAELPARTLRLAAPNAEALRPVEASTAAGKRVQVGIRRDVAEFAEAGTARTIGWRKAGEWRIAKIRVQSPQAKALRVGLRIGPTAEPWTLRVAGTDDETRVLGPVRLAGPLGRSELYWTPLTEGDGQVIEIASPASQPEPAVEVVTVSHLVTGPSARFAKTVAHIGASGSCNVDVKCVVNPSQALLNAAKAAVHMLFTTSEGSYMCTGTLLNDTQASTQIPYLFSANHCFENESPPYATAAQKQATASTLNTFFFFDAVACGSLATPPFVQRFGGATYLYSNQAQDILLVRLNEWAPRGAFLSGWDPNPVAAGSAVTIVHHPWGDLKKVTTGTAGLTTVLPSPVNAPTGYVTVVYTVGTCEPGSSGASLLTLSGSQYYVRGALLGGEASCTARSSPDLYSRFDVAYPALKPWLEATSLPAYDFTDLWYNAAESGWGLNLTQRPSGQVFGVWYTYAANGRPLWLVMSGGTWTTSRTFTGKLYRSSGPGYDQPFDPARVALTEVGTLTLNFTDANNATLGWVVDGVSGSKTITRLAF